MTIQEKRSSQEINDYLKSFLDVGEIYVKQLEADLMEAKRKLKVSDVYDTDNHQYVNLVQQGGGMLGVALLGYTYVLERMGIRFLKLAGTSAGAINATLMATVKPESTETLKTPIILYYLSRKNLIDFVDGDLISKFLLKVIFSTRKKKNSLIYRILFILIGIGPVIFFTIYALYKIASYFFGNISTNIPTSIYNLGVVWAIVLSIIVGLSIISLLYLYCRFKKSKYGINPGRAFHDWITDLMQNGEVHSPDDPDQPVKIQLKSGFKIDVLQPKNGIKSFHDLENKLRKFPKLVYNPKGSELYLKDAHPLKGLDKYDESEPPLAIIATELVTENKIVFPKMWKLFYEDRDSIPPADFVRASMSIPLFFEAFRIKNNLVRTAQRIEWLKQLGYNGNMIDEAVFVDGGSISNFPINVFNPTRASTPRLPTFGVRLISDNPSSSRSVNKFNGLISSIISTVRANYDKDFLITHPQFEQCLADIDVRDFDWLDFNLPLAQQIDMFKRGAEAAKNFLLQFNWEMYKYQQVALNVGVDSSKVRAAITIEAIQKLIQDEKSDRGIN